MAQIRDITDFGSIDELYELCCSCNEPVFITQNGHSDMVAMSREVYDRTIGTIEIHKNVAAAFRSAKKGNVADGDEALERLRKKYGYTVNEQASGQTEEK